MANTNISNDTILLSKTTDEIEEILSGYSGLTASVANEISNREAADEELSLRIANINGVEYIQVDNLPDEPLTGHSDAFYLIASETSDDNNLFTEYYWRNGQWEVFGSAALDLSSYIKKNEIDTSPISDSTNPVASGGVKSALDNKADKQTSDGGFSAGQNASATGGGAVGHGAIAYKGGAIGYNACTDNGFSGGYNAQTIAKLENGQNSVINAIQLGTGTNSNAFTTQIYDYQLLADDAKTPSATDGSKYLKDVGKLSELCVTDRDSIVSAINSLIPSINDIQLKQDILTFDNEPTADSDNPVKSKGIKAVLDTKASKSDLERELSNKVDKYTENGGFVAGKDAICDYDGVAIGDIAYADRSGISIGAKSSSTGGVCVGAAASANGSDEIAIGNGAKSSGGIQLGTGTNPNEYTMQVYDYQLLADDAVDKSATDGGKYLKDVGKLSSLTTTVKDNIVNAINNIVTALSQKVDKIDGKGLSANDYTDEEKAKLAELSNYDDTDIKSDIAKKADKLKSIPHTTVSGNPIAITDALAGEQPLEMRVHGCKNLFDENLLLEKDTVTKTENGYLITQYPEIFTSNMNLTKNFKSIVKPNTIYTMSRNAEFEPVGNSIGAITIRTKDETTGATADVRLVGPGTGKKSNTFSLSKYQIDNISYIMLYGAASPNEVTFSNIQLEEGETATEYEPCTVIGDLIDEKYEIPISLNNEQTVTAILDTPLSAGEYIDLVSKKRNGETDITVNGDITLFDGTNNITCQTENSPSKLEVSYYRDINKVIEELKNAILSQGGNV